MLGVKGPGPSCELIGRVPIAGKKGLNRVRFDGTVQQEARQTLDGVTLEFTRQVILEPGTYLLELTSRGGKRHLARTFVTIVDPESPKKSYAMPHCSTADLAALARSSGAAPFLAEPVTRHGSAPAAQTSRGAGPNDVSTVLGDAFPRGLGSPIPRVDDEEDSRALLPLILLAIVLASLLALLVVVYESLRRGRPIT